MTPLEPPHFDDPDDDLQPCPLCLVLIGAILGGAGTLAIGTLLIWVL